jgi:hypothetical protein
MGKDDNAAAKGNPPAEAGAARGQSGATISEVRKALAADRLQRARQAEKEIGSRVITVITTALALVAALFWQTAISDTVKAFIPISGAWQYEIGVALAVTLIAAVAIYMLSRSMDGLQKK